MPSLKQFVRRKLRSLVYEIVPYTSLERHAFAAHLRELFARLHIRCVLDVGANRGQFRGFLRDRVDYRGLIISFEPVAHNVALLRDKAKNDPAWVIRAHALGSVDGPMDMNVMKLDLLSSFRLPDHSKVPMLDDYNIVDHGETVQVRCLDSIIDELRAKHLMEGVYLKLDTQGFDLEVIRGASCTLPMISALQTELSVLPIYHGAPSYQEMLDALTDRNYGITAMFAVSRDERMRVIEFDCVMVNGEHGT